MDRIHFTKWTRMDQIVKSNEVGVNPFEMMTFSDDLIIAGYDSNELYVMDTDTVKDQKND